MDNKTPQQNEQVSNNQNEPENNAPTPSANHDSGMKVIQPLDPSPVTDSTPAPAVAQPIPTTPANPQEQTINAVTQPKDLSTSPPKQSSTPSSIYPDVTAGLASSNNNQSLPPIETKTDEPSSLNFSHGWSIGGTIFLFDFVAGIVFGLILRVIVSALSTKSVSVTATVYILLYLLEAAVLTYIPYSVIKSDNTEEPFWLTLFGVAIQTIISIGLVVVSLVLIGLLLSSSSSSTPFHFGIGGSGIGALIIAFIFILIAEYFLVKLEWGITFALAGKINNKLVIKIIGLVFIALLVGGIVFHFLTLHSSKLGASQPKINISKQELGSIVYTDPTSGYQITPPYGWLLANPPADTINGQKTSNTWWYYNNDQIDELNVTANSPSSGSLQADVQNWQSTQQTSNTGYKLISSNPITVNGVPAYYITDSWTTRTFKPQKITDQVLIEDNNGTQYTVDGNSYSQYASSFTGVFKQSLMSFKP